MFSALRLVRSVRPETIKYCARVFSAEAVGSKEYFDKLVANSKVVVFMKGTPDAPRCGFSNAVVQILRMHGVEYDAHNVLANEDVRQGIKEYSEWPTIPQVFMSGEFVGGCDILLQMHQNGELIEELQKVGITSALLEAEKSKGDEK
ncbi:Glutaredoxin-related protein 5, mitochondrial [Halocaridina rubra]|uniref:Glutaredoxin-related protein 5, mitochondrial n=1 Tax=Halocaridina rubra TaxID=373956 RepID=A0AAN9FUB6_HALRR